VAYRQWQQDVYKAANGKRTDRNLQGGDSWSQNPFSSPDRRL
jgi:hypothetical protein